MVLTKAVILARSFPANCSLAAWERPSRGAPMQQYLSRQFRLHHLVQAVCCPQCCLSSTMDGQQACHSPLCLSAEEGASGMKDQQAMSVC